MDASIAANNVGNFNKCVELAVHQTVLSGLKELLDSDMRESDSPRSQLSDGVNSSLSTESIPQLPSVVEYVEYPLPSPTIEVQSSFWPLLRPNPLWDVSVFPPNCIVCKVSQTISLLLLVTSISHLFFHSFNSNMFSETMLYQDTFLMLP